LSPTRTLVVNADDFGASEGVNRGVVQAHVHGIVTSTSLMVTGHAAEHAARLAGEHPGLGVGLHWDLDEEDLREPVPLEDASAVRRELASALGVPLREEGSVRYVGGFYGQWEWLVTDLEHIRPEYLIWILRNEVDEGWTEIGCHPGFVTDDFTSVYLAEREVEVATLTDPRIEAEIEALGIRLASYAELAGRDDSPD